MVIERVEVHRMIVEELCAGILRPESKVMLSRIMNPLVELGAEGIFLVNGVADVGHQHKSSVVPV